MGDASIPAEVLTGRLLRWVVDTVVRPRGARPATIALSHPANWGPYKRDLLDKAAEIAGVPEVVMVTEPEAAAISYSSQSRVEVGAVVAVYDLGGGTFDAAVLRKEADGGFTVLGSPEGIEHLGGVDIDAAVFARVCQQVEEAYEALDPDDPHALAAVSRLRAECTQAKEALSLDTEISVPVLLPTIQTEVRVTRSELEEMIRPTLSETVTAIDRALRSASVAPADVDHVLLVGGSSRIPLVAQLVSSGLGRPVAVDAHPKHAIALGAAIVAARAAGAPVGAALPPPPGAGATAGSPRPQPWVPGGPPRRRRVPPRPPRRAPCPRRAALRPRPAPRRGPLRRLVPDHRRGPLRLPLPGGPSSPPRATRPRPLPHPARRPTAPPRPRRGRPADRHPPVPGPPARRSPAEGGHPGAETGRRPMTRRSRPPHPRARRRRSATGRRRCPRPRAPRASCHRATSPARPGRPSAGATAASAG